MKTNKNKSSVKIFVIVIALLFISAYLKDEEKITVHLIGDSTMADKPAVDNPERGWGQMLPVFFKDNVVVKNHARNGRSTKSFINEGRWQKVLEELKQGDYVFIQFGHNDAKQSDSTRYANPHGEYKTNLIKYIDETKAKGGVPVLITPVYRRKFDENSKLADSHGEYPGVVREAAKEKNVPLIDLHKKSEELLTSAGVEVSKKFYLGTKRAKSDTSSVKKEDNTHFTQYGAVTIASLAAAGIKEIKLPLADYLSTSVPDPEIIKTAALDYYFNHEIKNDQQYHYIWEDEEFSGFSELGRIITNLNAGITSIRSAPSKELLSEADIYIIVDPDTKSETAAPNYIDAESRSAIVEWVKEGGILVILANDSANCEFDSLNLLTGNFGIHFNGDSKNRVTGKNFDMGRIDKFPDHPVFKNVKSIYLKEISTLILKDPAKPVLIHEGNIVIGSSEFGKGFVFAVGDPWFYNEYLDNWKLPEGFENFKAAKNLFEWLLNMKENKNTGPSLDE
ncbi:MAG: GDSL-type esterase/lipase family protein [Ignavibacteriaceae bacterium]